MTCHMTSVYGANADLIKHVFNFYIRPGATICDPTFGKGRFWKKVDLTEHSFFPSDLKTCPKTPYDFRCLPYPDSFFSLVVLDPPYSHMGKTPRVFEKSYRNLDTTANMNNANILALYTNGMREAWRILQGKGLLFLKCMDEIESGRQRRNHIALYDIAMEIGFIDQELYILHPNNLPVIKRKNHQHARKDHSYLWVFRKPHKPPKKRIGVPGPTHKQEK